ncbi:hypothetical protein MRX96_057906 [Rhipicephalus microplus]
MASRSPRNSSQEKLKFRAVQAFSTDVYDRVAKLGGHFSLSSSSASIYTERTQYIASSMQSRSSVGRIYPTESCCVEKPRAGEVPLGSPPGVALFHPDSDLVN